MEEIFESLTVGAICPECKKEIFINAIWMKSIADQIDPDKMIAYVFSEDKSNEFFTVKGTAILKAKRFVTDEMFKHFISTHGG